MKWILAITAAAATGLILPGPASAADAKHGSQLYHNYCIQCHGLNGDGKGINASHLDVQPRNHTDRDEMTARTDEDLFKAIKLGGQSVNKSILMPNWDGNLTDDNIHDIVAYLRELCCQ